MSYQHKSYRLPLRSRSRSRQQGVVIVVALFIVALVATMSYVMMSRLARDTRRTELILHDVQAELYAGGSVMWAKDALHNNWIKQKKDKPVDVLPITSPVNDMNGYSIMSTIRDGQGKFNLNNVSKPEWQPAFIQLMRLTYPKIGQEDAAAIARATIDWLMPGNRENEYSRYYAELPISYRAAHRFMVDPAELRLVKGVTPELYAALKPYVTALPTITPVSMQSVTPQVLAALGTNMSIEAAQAIIEVVAKNPPPNLEAFLALDVVKNHPINKDFITMTSGYFLVETEVGIEHQRILLYTLLQRNNDAKAEVMVLWQNRG